MAQRRIGTLPLQENIETEKQMPLDARQLVRSKEEMLTEGSFTYGYKGLFTAERTEGKIWMLMDNANPTQESSWKVIGPYDDSALDARVTALEQGSGGESGPVDWSDVQNKPSFASVATSGSYNDLADRPVLPAPYDDSALSGRVSALENAGFLTEHQDISGKANTADLATVATSGSYNDLSDQPTIPEAYDDSALDARVTALENASPAAPAWDAITGKPDFANVATSGDYNDLGNKPTIPEAYDDTEVRNLIAGKANTADLAPVATSGSYNDLGDKPVIPEAYDDTEVRGLIAAKANSADLATVATSGSYNDLGDKPTIPEAYDDTALAARVTAVETDLGGLAAVATSGSYNDLSDKPTIPAEVTVDSAMSDTSENPVQNKVVVAAIGDAIDVVETAIADRYTKAETDAKIAEAMTDVDNEHFHPVTALPDAPEAKENHEYVLITYAQDGTTIESETHYLFYDGVFHLKETQISLEGYATETYVDTATDALDTRVTAIETALNLTALTDEEIAALVP